MRGATAIVACIAALGVSACTSGASGERTAEAAPAATSEPARSSPAPKPLTLDYDRKKPFAGTPVHLSADGLPPDRSVEILWGTVDGGWVIEGYSRFRGKKFTETTRSLGQARVDAAGRLSAQFTIPEDYGGVHEVMVSDAGRTIAQGGIEVGQTFEIHPAEGPIGTPVELRVKGLGWRTMESTWVVNWDNQEIGWVSATSTRGPA